MSSPYHQLHSSSEHIHRQHVHPPCPPRSPSPSSGTSGTEAEDGGSLSRRTPHRNPLKSFKVPGPPGGPSTPRPKHIGRPWCMTCSSVVHMSVHLYVRLSARFMHNSSLSGSCLRVCVIARFSCPSTVRGFLVKSVLSLKIF